VLYFVCCTLALSPYYYSLMFEASRSGMMVTRPLVFEFPQEAAGVIEYIDRQFMIGRGLLISPVLENGARTVRAYFPDEVWYDYWSGVVQPTAGWVTLDGECFSVGPELLSEVCAVLTVASLLCWCAGFVGQPRWIASLCMFVVGLSFRGRRLGRTFRTHG